MIIFSRQRVRLGDLCHPEVEDIPKSEDSKRNKKDFFIIFILMKK